jgi:hypothetical protein
MIIKGATKEEVENALAKVNSEFDNNVRFKTFKELKPTRAHEPVFSVTLTVHSSKAKGARRTYDGHRLAAACWHVHGTFFDSLPEGTQIRVSRMKPIRPGDAWQDWNAGSQARPAFISELCDCGL